MPYLGGETGFFFLAEAKTRKNTTKKTKKQKKTNKIRRV